MQRIYCSEESCVRDMENADKLVRKTLEIIEYLRPEKWWIENPRNGYLRTRGILDNYPYVDLDYCQLSDWGTINPQVFGAHQMW